MRNQITFNTYDVPFSGISSIAHSLRPTSPNVSHLTASERVVPGIGGPGPGPLDTPGRCLNLIFGGMSITNRVPGFGMDNISSSRADATREDLDLVQHALFANDHIDLGSISFHTDSIDGQTFMNLSYRSWSPDVPWFDATDLEVNIRTLLHGDAVSCEIIHWLETGSYTLHVDFTQPITHSSSAPPAPSRVLSTTVPDLAEWSQHRDTHRTIDCGNLAWLETGAVTNPDTPTIPPGPRNDVANALRNASSHPLDIQTPGTHQEPYVQITHGDGPAMSRVDFVEAAPGRLHPTRVHYYPEGTSGALSMRLRNPQFEHVRDSTITSIASLPQQSETSTITKRSRSSSPNSQIQERSVCSRIAEFKKVDASVLLLQPPPGVGGCPAAVINHLFQAPLLLPEDLPQGTLGEIARAVVRMSQVTMKFHTVVLPSTGVYKQFAPDVRMQIDTLEADIKNGCKAAFEIGNLSDTGGGRTHQVTLIYMAGRSEPGQLTGNDPFVIVLDSFDDEMKQAMAWYFDTVKDALMFIAGRTSQPDGRVLSAVCPAVPLPPPTTDLTFGGDILGHGHVKFENLSEVEKTALKKRAEEFRPFSSVDGDEPEDIGMEDYLDPVWNERIHNLQLLTQPESRRSMIEFWREHPDWSPKDVRLTAAVDFLAHQATQRRDALAFLQQPLDVRCLQVGDYVKTTTEQTNPGRQSVMRRELAPWLEWSSPKTELFERRGSSVWVTRMNNNLRDVSRPHQNALIRYYRLRRLTGLAPSSAKTDSVTLRNTLLRPLEDTSIAHTTDFVNAWHSGNYDSQLDAFLSLKEKPRKAELTACVGDSSSQALQVTMESLRYLDGKVDPSVKTDFSRI